MKTRSNTPSSRKNRKRQPSHLKIHHEMLRKRQLEEQRLRAEAAGKEAEEAIARKFQTDTEESRIQRRRDRVGLLGKLQARRFDLIKNCEVDESDNVPLSSLGKPSKGEAAEAEAGEVKKEGDAKVVPRLTASSAANISDESSDDDDADDKVDAAQGQEQKEQQDATKKADAKPKRANVIDDSSSDEDSDDDGSDEDSDDDDQMELEIVTKAAGASPAEEPSAPSPSKASSALDILAGKKKPARRAPVVKKAMAPGRATLRNALRAKQVQAGNKWLARYVLLSAS